MPDLRRVLSDYDLGLLRLVSELWGRPDLAARSQREAVDELVGRMLQPEAAAAVVAELPPEARAAFETLAQVGRQPLAAFTRRHGELRAMGPARREREKPWANAPSDTEQLWYRGLVGRAFFNEGTRLEEFVFIPDDLRALIYVGPAEPPGALAAEPPGRPLGQGNDGQPAAGGGGPEPIDEGRGTEDEAPMPAAHDAVTLLAYLQVNAVRGEALAQLLPPSPSAADKPPGASLPAHPHARLYSATYTLTHALLQPPALPLYLHLLRDLGLITGGLGREVVKLDPERVQPFLQSGPAERQRQLAEAWREARGWNDLLHLPGLAFEGTAWSNDAYAARQAVLKLLAGVPAGVWWSLPAFRAAVKDRQPDFQRPAGDYASWYIRDAATGAYLRGFENWERVDGALVEWLITGPLSWLGLAALTPPDAPEPGFRLTPAGAALLGQAGWETGQAAPPPPFDLTPAGVLRVPAGASAYDRFQAARISEWRPPEPGPVYVYALTPAALGRAARKAITPARIRQFLERGAPGHPALPALAAALERWARRGPEAALCDVAVLRLAGPELLDELRRHPRLRDLLGEALGPASVAVRRDDLAAVRAALAELGVLVDGD
ncbi:MAG: hypothetical protein IT318_01005 [Anaerolineales bacterium]|nr:hypothetical protein [Anaerolineales bacterium]